MIVDGQSVVPNVGGCCRLKARDDLYRLKFDIGSADFIEAPSAASVGNCCRLLKSCQFDDIAVSQ